MDWKRNDKKRQTTQDVVHFIYQLVISQHKEKHSLYFRGIIGRKYRAGEGVVIFQEKLQDFQDQIPKLARKKLQSHFCQQNLQGV